MPSSPTQAQIKVGKAKAFVKRVADVVVAAGGLVDAQVITASGDALAEYVQSPTRDALNAVVAAERRKAEQLVAAPEASHLTAAVITPPPELWEPINAIRAELEPRHVDIWPPHITLFYPFWPVSSWSNAIDPLAAALAGMDPFTVVLSEFGTFSQGRRGKLTYLKPDDDSTVSLRALRTSMRDDIFPDLRARFSQPHMTVGRGQHEEQASRLQGDWQPIAFEAQSVTLLARPIMGEPLEVLAELPIGPGGSVSRAALDAHLDASASTSSDAAVHSLQNQTAGSDAMAALATWAERASIPLDVMDVVWAEVDAALPRLAGDAAATASDSSA
ncbi:polynucleotide adenyltransferase [Thecamonas trahens ATCC 50062]|uniref:Polynucleotide adenyltransferase n=1 Tax=Thecamonas trahens ATCC 50062 TaxID=461836 RepID=A0A0L0DQZ7_THETB|nr:polynucleotide adenyltransferase [Thecamonas trahens ATCC 50062]KNC54707.1 polynucleotide adenyltransferase [Thecamonas trahens ATCC 50062]|eukprot:XP_013761607.1 polynucleotide adenyltransferase [Thecamonas trahens ATCC 50062]